MKSMKLTIAVIATIGLLAGVTDWNDAPSAASTAAPYTNLDAGGEPLKTAFNDAVGKIRVVAYVAPTCGGCLRGAKLLQEEVLDRVGDDDLSVLVVWVPKNAARERNVDRVTELVTDDRSQQFWDGHGFVVEALDARLGLVGRECAGAFLVYGPEAVWTGSAAPEPAYWSDAHDRDFEQHGPRFNPDTLRDEIQRLLRSGA